MKTNWFVLCQEIPAVYCGNRKKKILFNYGVLLNCGMVFVVKQVVEAS